MADEVSIPVHLLESIKQIMTSAFYFSQTADLSDSYRKLKGDLKWSPMTQQLSRNIELIQSFIDLAGQEDEEVSEDAENGDTDE